MQIRLVRSDADWEAARTIRRHVFIEEQHCPPDEEWDDYDAVSRHVLGIENGAPVATARWRAVPLREEAAAKLERFAVLPVCRGRGYGRALVAYVLDDARRAGFGTFVLHAQARLEDFYAAFGFERQGAPFMEAGIAHVKMIRRDPV